MSVVRRPIRKLLIANRGEIACRIMRTARKMGVATVAVWSDPDKFSQHVSMADEAVRIGAAAPSASYLNMNKLLEVAKKTQADAIHPGYGFLSENSTFAAEVVKHGLVFVGPTAQSMTVMGQKHNAKQMMIDAEVPVIPGYHGAGQNVEDFLKAARKTSYPVMLKAVSGGGGKGMRTVHSEAELRQALESAASEAKASFGDGQCLLEKLVVGARHIEVQVFGDQHGGAVHLFERDCSTQRRHQKLLEESPAPGIPQSVRQAMWDAAVRATKAVKYVGAGTIEFLLDPSTHEFYFLEMNTRLQVEHTVTEMVTGLDLVEWQLRVAAGEPLPLSQAEIERRGAGRYAVEARICAERAERTRFAPSAGVLSALVLPVTAPGVRVDAGVRERDAILPWYDSMIAKIITSSDKSRTEALTKLDEQLGRTLIAGVDSNVTFLRSVLNDSVYRNGTMTTDHVEKVQDTLVDWCEHWRSAAQLAAAVSLHLRSKFTLGAQTIWGASKPALLLCDGATFAVTEKAANSFIVAAPGGANGTLEGDFNFTERSHNMVTIDGVQHSVAVRWDNSKHAVNVWVDGRHYAFPVEMRHSS
jgi:3-methylcrotonyl-CoA carboxylase alpha subunit